MTDRDSRYVTDIDVGRFQVYEDGALQDITFFTRTQLPIALSLLMDTSASMTEKMETAQQAAIGFAERLREEDLASVIDFDSRVDIRQGFTNSLDDLALAIRRTSAGGSTSLYNAIYISLKELGKIAASVTGRSGARPSSCSRTARTRRASSTSTRSSSWPSVPTPSSIRSACARGTSAPGGGSAKPTSCCASSRRKPAGRAFFPQRVDDLAAIYQQISDELSSQYTLGYSSKNPLRDGRWRRLVVRIDQPNVAARTKQGYYAPTMN